MFCFHSSVVPAHHHIDMAKSVNSTDRYVKLKQINQFYRNKRFSNSPNRLNIPACEHSRSAIIDVIIFIAVIGALGCLFYPYATVIGHKTVELTEEVAEVLIEEIVQAPMVFGCLGLSILCAAMALVAIVVCTDRKCGKFGCRGLSKAAEFDIQLETEYCVRNSVFPPKTASLKMGLFELSRDHHRELEAELKKIAPPNGRAVLVFRARCGCSVGRLEVLGPRKSRKVKK